jgi:hypothetical protein
MARLLACHRRGDHAGASGWYARAFEPVLKMADPWRAEVYLLRCSVLVVSPAIARIWTSRACLLAKEHGVREEEGPTLGNLGLVHLELGEMEEAQARLEESLRALDEPTARAVALNNLALTVAHADRSQALTLLAAAAACADRRHAVAVTSNRLVLDKEGSPHPPDFGSLVASEEAGDCDAPLFDRVLYNHVCALLGAGEPERALEEVEARESRRRGLREGGRWARLRVEALRALGRPCPAGPVLSLRPDGNGCATSRVWLSSGAWALCPIPFDAPAVRPGREHPELAELLAFADGGASRPTRRAIVRHLLRRCADCAGTMRSAFEPDGERLEDGPRSRARGIGRPA